MNYLEEKIKVDSPEIVRKTNIPLNGNQPTIVNQNGSKVGLKTIFKVTKHPHTLKVKSQQKKLSKFISTINKKYQTTTVDKCKNLKTIGNLKPKEFNLISKNTSSEDWNSCNLTGVNKISADKCENKNFDDCLGTKNINETPMFTAMQISRSPNDGNFKNAFNVRSEKIFNCNNKINSSSTNTSSKDIRELLNKLKSRSQVSITPTNVASSKECHFDGYLNLPIEEKYISDTINDSKNDILEKIGLQESEHSTNISTCERNQMTQQISKLTLVSTESTAPEFNGSTHLRWIMSQEKLSTLDNYKKKNETDNNVNIFNGIENSKNASANYYSDLVKTSNIEINEYLKRYKGTKIEKREKQNNIEIINVNQEHDKIIAKQPLGQLFPSKQVFSILPDRSKNHGNLEQTNRQELAILLEKLKKRSNLITKNVFCEEHKTPEKKEKIIKNASFIEHSTKRKSMKNCRKGNVKIIRTNMFNNNTKIINYLKVKDKVETVRKCTSNQLNENQATILNQNGSKIGLKNIFNKTKHPHTLKVKSPTSQQNKLSEFISKIIKNHQTTTVVNFDRSSRNYEKLMDTTTKNVKTNENPEANELSFTSKNKNSEVWCSSNLKEVNKIDTDKYENKNVDDCIDTFSKREVVNSITDGFFGIKNINETDMISRSPNYVNNSKDVFNIRSKKFFNKINSFSTNTSSNDVRRVLNRLKNQSQVSIKATSVGYNKEDSFDGHLNLLVEKKNITNNMNNSKNEILDRICLLESEQCINISTCERNNVTHQISELTLVSNTESTIAEDINTEPEVNKNIYLPCILSQEKSSGQDNYEKEGEKDDDIYIFNGTETSIYSKNDSENFYSDPMKTCKIKNDDYSKRNEGNKTEKNEEKKNIEIVTVNQETDENILKHPLDYLFLSKQVLSVLTDENKNNESLEQINRPELSALVEIPKKKPNEIIKNVFCDELVYSIVSEEYKKQQKKKEIVENSSLIGHLTQRKSMKNYKHSKNRPCCIKKYRKGNVIIYRLKKLKNSSSIEINNHIKDPNIENVLKQITQNYIEPKSQSKKLENLNFTFLSSSSSFVTDTSLDTTLEDPYDFATPQQKLKTKLTELLRDKSLLCEKEKQFFSEYDKHEINMKIKAIFLGIYDDINRGRNSHLKFRRQSFDNCIFKDNRLQFKPSNEVVNTIISSNAKNTRERFKLILYVMSKVQTLLETNTKLTKRELYYQFKDIIKNQELMNRAINATSCILDVGMWALNIVAQKGLVFGNLKILLSNGETLNCNLSGTLIPQDIGEIVELQSTASFILVVEKESIFYKLIEEDLLNKLARPFIMITGKGFPDLNTQLFLRKLWIVMSLPVFIMVDADPHGVQIMLNYRFGSLNNAHVSQHLAVPNAKWLGIYPSELNYFDITTQPLTAYELKLVDHLLKTPYMDNNPRIAAELKVMLDKKYKAGIESLMKSSIFLSEVYLPTKFFLHKFI